MSTRANIIIKDDDYHKKGIQLYRHCDGYPDTEHGIIEGLKSALDYAWHLPRMEADDMAAAIIRAWKEEGGGNIYIDGTANGLSTLHGDIDYLYVVSPDKIAQKWLVEVFAPKRKNSEIAGLTKKWSGYIGDTYGKANMKIA